LESEGTGEVEAMDQDDDDTVLENVVTGGMVEPEVTGTAGARVQRVRRMMDARGWRRGWTI
jgi:hypothetical protein